MRRLASLFVMVIVAFAVFIAVDAYPQLFHSTSKPFLNLNGTVRDVSVFPNGSVAVVEVPKYASPTGFLAVYSADGERLWTLKFGTPDFLVVYESVEGVSAAPDGRYIAVLTDRNLRLYNPSRKLLWKVPLNQSEDSYSRVLFTPDSRHIIVYTWGESLRVWVFSTNGSPVRYLEMNSSPLAVIVRAIGSALYMAVEDEHGTTRIMEVPFEGNGWTVVVPNASSWSAPRGLAVFKTSNRTYVAYVDCEKGVYLIRNGSIVWHRSPFGCPWDVAIWEGKIYVSDSYRVLVYGLNGTLLRSLHFPGFVSGPGTFFRCGQSLALTVIEYSDSSWETHIYLLTADEIHGIFNAEGRPPTDYMSHVRGACWRGNLILAINDFKKWKGYVYEVPVDSKAQSP